MPGRRRSTHCQRERDTPAKRRTGSPLALAELRTVPAHPDERLTVEEICTELKGSWRTFDRWQATYVGGT